MGIAKIELRNHDGASVCLAHCVRVGVDDSEFRCDKVMAENVAEFLRTRPHAGEYAVFTVHIMYEGDGAKR